MKLYRSKKSKIALVVTTIVIMLFLSIGHDFFHNHTFDFKHHHGCPAHEIYLLFTSIIITPILFLFINLYKHIYIEIYVEKLISAQLTNKHNSRAPPRF